MKYWDNIELCPLSVFKDVINNNNYKALLIEGEFKESEAVKAWILLYDQYSDKVNNKTNNIIFMQKKQAYILSIEYQLISNCLFAITELQNCNLISMRTVHDLTYFIKTVNEYGYKFDESKGFYQEVDRVKKQLNMKLKKIELIEKEIDKKQDGSKGSFTDTIAAVEKFLGFQINEEKTTVAKFATYLNMLINSNENGRKQHKVK